MVENGKPDGFLETVRLKNKLDHGSDINMLDLSYLKPTISKNYEETLRQKRIKQRDNTSTIAKTQTTK